MPNSKELNFDLTRKIQKVNFYYKNINSLTRVPYDSKYLQENAFVKSLSYDDVLVLNQLLSVLSFEKMTNNDIPKYDNSRILFEFNNSDIVEIGVKMSYLKFKGDYYHINSLLVDFLNDFLQKNKK